MVDSVRKPDGGFCFIQGRAILGAWWAYKTGIIGLRDLRVWLASFEVVARRCGLPEGRRPKHRVEELHALVGGVGGEHVGSSVRALERAGLLRWSETRVEHGAGGYADNESTSALTGALALVAHPERLVPAPRRLLRLLAAERRPVLIATALGHLLRCSYYRRGRCTGRGRCKASWVAGVFGVDARNVKGARSELVRLGILSREEGPQRLANRWGGAVVLNLQWRSQPMPERAPRLVNQVIESPPRAACITTGSPPPGRTKNSSFGRSENQEPGEPDAAGVRTRTGRGPSLRNIVPEDLRSRSHLRALFLEAARAGYVRPTQADALRFLAAAAHARRVGTRNACGLFAAIVRRGLWAYISQADEEYARRCLAAWRSGSPAVSGSARSAPRTREPVRLGAILHAVEQSLKRATVQPPGKIESRWCQVSQPSC